MPLCKNLYCIKEVKKNDDECYKCRGVILKETLIGIGLARLDYRLIMQSSFIVAINIIGIYLGSLLAFAGLWLQSKKE